MDVIDNRLHGAIDHDVVVLARPGLENIPRTAPDSHDHGFSDPRIQDIGGHDDPLPREGTSIVSRFLDGEQQQLFPLEAGALFGRPDFSDHPCQLHLKIRPFMVCYPYQNQAASVSRRR